MTPPKSYVANGNISSCMNDETRRSMEFEVKVRVAELLLALQIDYKDDPQTLDTPERVAKMFCRGIFAGRYEPQPEVTMFPNLTHRGQLVCVGPLAVRSTCSHHLCPIIGRIWIGFVAGDQLPGLSKFSRLVEWVCARPQIQEEMTDQITQVLLTAIKPDCLFVLIEAEHTCMTWRGVKEHGDAKMMTRCFTKERRELSVEFLAFVNRTS